MESSHSKRLAVQNDAAEQRLSLQQSVDLRLEAEAGSAFRPVRNEPDPFETRTGYHRIAVEVMGGLVSETPRTVVVNICNEDSIDDLSADDVVEVPSQISTQGVKPDRVGRLPESVRGLVLPVKAYERATIRAVVEKSWPVARLAMLEYPSYRPVGDRREPAKRVDGCRSGVSRIPEGLGRYRYIRRALKSYYERGPVLL